MIACSLSCCSFQNERAQKSAQLPEETYIVSKKDITLGIHEVGVFRSLEEVPIIAGISRTKITRLVPEGTRVSKGEPIVWLDARELEQEYEKAKISVKEWENWLKRVLQDVEARIYKLKRELEEAKARYEFAKVKWEIAKHDLEQKKEFLANKLISEDEYLKAKEELQTRELDMKLKEIALERVKTEYDARLGLAELEVQIARQRFETGKFRLYDLGEDLNNTICYAPKDGLFMHASTWRGEKIKEGTGIWHSQTLGFIPDLNRMHLVTQVAESLISHVKVGMRVEIKVEALEGLELLGTVHHIGPLAIERKEAVGAGFISDDYTAESKVFEIQVQLDRQHGGLKPGMSASVILVEETFKDCLAIPTEAIFGKEGDLFVYKKTALGSKKIPLKIKARDHKWAVVESGISEGDEILTSMPRG